MCIVMIKNKGGKIGDVTQYIGNCMAHNAHGSGYMFSRDNKVHIRKGFWKAKDVLKSVEQDDIQDNEVFVFHARWATHGAENVTNCHPFVITANPKLFERDTLICNKAVAHNGIIDTPLDYPKLSDTANFTLSILSDPTVLSNIGKSTGIDYMIDRMIGWSKLAILHGSGKLQLVGQWQFVHDDDVNIMASNDNWRPFIGFKNYGKTKFPIYGTDALSNDCAPSCFECMNFEDCENGTGYCYNSKEMVMETDTCSAFMEIEQSEGVIGLTMNNEANGEDCSTCLWNTQEACNDREAVYQKGCKENYVPVKESPAHDIAEEDSCSNCWLASKVYMGREACSKAAPGNTCKDIQYIVKTPDFKGGK